MAAKGIKNGIKTALADGGSLAFMCADLVIVHFQLLLLFKQ